MVPIAKCTKCGTVMKSIKCQNHRTVKVSVTTRDGKAHSLTLFNDIINDIIGSDSDDPARSLLMAPAMKFSVDSNNVVVAIKKL